MWCVFAAAHSMHARLPFPLPISNLKLSGLYASLGALLRHPKHSTAVFFPLPLQTRNLTRPAWWVRRNFLDAQRQITLKLSLSLTLAPKPPLGPENTHVKYKMHLSCMCTFMHAFGDNHYVFVSSINGVWMVTDDEEDLEQNTGTLVQ